MSDNFEEIVYREFDFKLNHKDGNLIKSSSSSVAGKTKISVEEDSHDGVKVVLKKDDNDSIKEIKFVCSCGQTKTIILDYSD